MARTRCAKLRGLLSAYLDGELGPREYLLVDKHLEDCPACRAELETLRLAAAAAREMPAVELPEGFHAGLVKRVEVEAPSIAARARQKGPARAWREFWESVASGSRRVPYRGIAVAAAAILLVLWGGSFLHFMGVPIPGENLFRIGSAPTDEAAPEDSGYGNLAAAPPGLGEYAPDKSAGSSNPEERGLGSAVGDGADSAGSLSGIAGDDGQPAGIMAIDEPAAGRKVTLTVNLTLECRNVTEVKDRAAAAAGGVGGFVESLNYWNDASDQTMATMVLRVPADTLQSVLDQLRGLGERVVNEQAARQDVTNQYIDINARVNNLRLQEQRLLTLVGQASSLGDVFAIENELSRVRTEIETYESQLRNLNERIDLSTINLSLEPVGPSPLPGAGFWDQVADAFKKSLEWLGGLAGDLVIFAAAALAPLAVLAVIIWVIYLAIRSRRRRAGA